MSQMLPTADRFYVYEHLRSDNGSVFYVGKGTGYRSGISNKHHRSNYWLRVSKKAGGFIVRMVAEHLPEELAFLIEIERIDQLRKMGVQLCNMTNGGDGISGWEKTPEWRAKVGNAHRGKVLTQEVRDKISQSVRATGYTHSEEAKKRMVEARKGKRPGLGRKQPESERAMRSALNKGNKSRTGQKRSEEEKAKQSLAMRGRKQAVLTCPHCKKSGGNSMRVYHFEFCPKLVNK